MSKPERRLLGYHLNQLDLPDLINHCSNSLHRAEARIMSCANPHSLALAQKDKAFRAALENSDYLIADGVGVNLATYYLGFERCPRITGHDFFCASMHYLDTRFEQDFGRPGRVLFFGSSQHVLSRIRSKLEQEYPNIEIADMISPPFGNWDQETNDALLSAIRAAQPDVIWVGMTAPKQEKWTYQNRDQLPPAIIGNIGAVFDFYAETYPRAPKWACSLGLEWLVRLLREPKRMWRRTFISLPAFVAYTLVNRFHQDSPTDARV